MSVLTRIATGGGLVLALPTAVLAHPGHGAAEPNSFLDGLGHPVGGIDHLLAMLVVGFWAGLVGGRSAWALPLAFVSIMAAGGMLGIAGLALPFTAVWIAVSVLTLGTVIAMALRPPLPVSVAVVGLFALFHGLAHGQEVPADASGLAYALGFTMATAALHAAGLGLGSLVKSAPRRALARLVGGSIAAVGAYLVAALVV